jgi:hypothetical protein
MCRCASTTRATKALEFGREEAAARVSCGGVYAYLCPTTRKIVIGCALSEMVHLELLQTIYQ